MLGGCRHNYMHTITFLVQDYVKSLKDNGELLDKLASDDNNSVGQVSYGIKST
jgi:hypothetical protein